MGGSGAPQLRKGASVTGISTITQAVIGNTTINAGGINATGIVTSSSNKFVGDLASGNITAGVMTATSSVVGSGVTINAGGINIGSGIVSATSYIGSGANLTGIALSVAPLSYTPSLGATGQALAPTIKLSLNQRVKAGSGNVSLRMVSAGSTIIENFGVGNSVTIGLDGGLPTLSFTPTSNLAFDSVIYIDIPAGAFTDNIGTNLAATNWTFTTGQFYSIWSAGKNENGEVGQNNRTNYSSPVQIPGNWAKVYKGSRGGGPQAFAAKNAGELWAWGDNRNGVLGLNDVAYRSSPTQVGSDTTWSSIKSGSNNATIAVKTDGTLWSWGHNEAGALGQSQADSVKVSSPTQVGSDTTWGKNEYELSSRGYSCKAVKTDGTLWAWGENTFGVLGQNQAEAQLGMVSSPVQIPGTTWKTVSQANMTAAIKTDGTLWVWGYGGGSGLNGTNTPNNTNYSSPTQVGSDTTWSKCYVGYEEVSAIKTDGTLWAWGNNQHGQCAQNNDTPGYSSPVQIPGTTWARHYTGASSISAVKTDGTLWAWGSNDEGQLGHNQGAPGAGVRYSSPVQIPGTDWYDVSNIYVGYIWSKNL